LAEGIGGEWTPAEREEDQFLSSEKGTESIVGGRGEAIEKVQDLRYLGSDLAADDGLDAAASGTMQTAPVQLKMGEQRLRRFGHVLKRPQSYSIREAMEFEAQGKRHRGAPKKRWRDMIKKDLAKPR
uniref:Ribosome biogenesis protein NOP53 n=1 Tax=Haemonchus placei TaxID=6290 RepID=A0A0N4WQN3_HAEPC